MTMIDSQVEESALRVLKDHAEPATVEAAEAGTWPAALWTAVTEAGLHTALDDGFEGLGGAAAIARAVGANPAPIPLIETIMVRGLGSAAGLTVPEGPLTLAPPRFAEVKLSGGRLKGSITGVPFGRWCGHVAVATDGQLALVPAKGIKWTHGTNTAGEPLDSADIDVTLAAGACAKLALDADALGALLRAMQLAGGMRAALALTLQYANDRVQFGRSIGKFQAIQHGIAIMAENVAAADTAANQALRLWGTPSQRIYLAAAKIRCGEAAGLSAETAHQVHGAIGFTREHRLHHVTRRLWSWRDEFGHEGDWAIELGRTTLAQGAEGLWPLVTGADQATQTAGARS